MNKPIITFSKKEKITVIFAVTIGNLLEWYEIYLFVYWAPVISKLFFSPGTDNSNLIDVFLLFFLGFLARPIGGIFFGRLGDRIGRKKVLILSILMMSIPSFLMAILPTFSKIGHFSTWLLAILRILQSFPAGGEAPGAACYLYESSAYNERKYMTSWTAIGYQTGIIIATIECYLLEKFFTAEQLLNWGWRLSFLMSSGIGMCGLLLRSKLHETPLFQDLANHARVAKDPLLKTIQKYKRALIQSALYCFLVSPAFYFISINFSSYFKFGNISNYLNDSILTSFFLLLVTVPVPFIGKLADIYSLKKIIISSNVFIIALIYPLYYSINNELFSLFFVSAVLFCLCIACITALTPYIMCDLFPTKVRFTGVALSYNLVDAVIGGIAPAAILFLLKQTGNKGSFCWLLLACAVVSLVSFFFIKERLRLKQHS